MKVVTVTGNVDPEDLGVTMTHEHIRYLTHDNLQDKFCDDYLAKPFELRELLLRVAAILRRTDWYGQSEAQLVFGDNEVNFQSYHARAWDGREHALTHKEAMILKMLTEKAGIMVPREDILDKVWGYEVFPSTRTIDNFIVRLRKRFEKNPDEPQYFHTVRGIGYRFTLEPETFDE